MKEMKKGLTLLLILTLAVFMAIPAVAVNGTVGKYTPVLDGEKDEAYDQSVKINLYADQDIPKGEYFHSEGDVPDTNAADATAWFLYDDAFVYVFVDVTDPDMYDIGKELFDSRVNNYQADSAELWLVFGDDYPYVKFSAVAYGHGMFGDLDGGAVTASEFAEAGYDTVTKTRGDGYSIEYKIPITQYGLKEGGTFYFTLQINNMVSEDNLVVSGRQLPGAANTDDASALTLGAPITIAAPEPEPEPEPEPPAATEEQPAPAPEAPAPAEPAPAAPATGDGLAVTAMIFALAAVCLSLSKKKKAVK